MEATFDLRLYELNAQLLENWEATFGKTSKLSVKIVPDEVEDNVHVYSPEFMKKMDLAQQQFDCGDYKTFSDIAELKNYVEEITQIKL